MGIFNRRNDDSVSLFDFSDDETSDVINHTVTATPKQEVADEIFKLSDEEEMQTEPEKAVAPLAEEVEEKVTEEAEDDKVSDEKTEHKTLLEKLHPYTIDEDGKDMSIDDTPIYELKSVADIIKSNGDRVLDKLSKKYDIAFDDLGKKPEKVAEPKVDDSKKAPQKEQEVTDKKTVTNTNQNAKTAAFVQMVNNSLAKRLEENKNEHTQEKLPDISDIDNNVSEKQSHISDNSQEKSSTVIFTPVKGAKPDTKHINISHTNSDIDLGSPFIDDSADEQTVKATELEESDFDTFSPSDEYTDEKSGKQLFKSIALKKRSSFLKSVISGLMLILLCLFFIPSLHDLLIIKTKGCMIACAVALFISFVVNLDMTLSIKDIFKKSASSDIPPLFASVAVILLTVLAIIKSVNIFNTVFICVAILFLRSLSQFWHFSAKLGNLKQILNQRPKKAVSLISDPATSYAIAKNAVDGDALIAAPRSTSFIEGFSKYYCYSSKLSGKLGIISLVSLAAAIVSGIAVSTNSSLVSGIQLAAQILCIMSLPTVFFIDALPMFSASLKLNKKGAMISGITAAENLEMANTVVLSSADLFPSGSIILQSMRVLSENNIDNTILKAATLTKAVNSPLYNVFQKIASTGTVYETPSSDTVKYEEKLGISGWVDNELLFVGNRALLEGHGIKVPSFEVDKSILRRGFFPIYIATADKACALLSVQYVADKNVVSEMRKLTSLGVTVLVDNCDQNVTEEMLCDYLGLYEGYAKPMTKAAIHIYNTATRQAEKCMAPAAFRTSNLTVLSILNCAANIKKSNLLLTLSYIILSVLGVALFLYSAFTSKLADSNTVLIYELAATIISFIIYLIKKP